MSLSQAHIGSLFPDLDMNEVSFLSMLEEFFEGVIVTDARGRVLFINSEQARMDDLAPEGLRGEKVTDIYHVDDGDSPVMQCIRTKKAVKGLACYYRTPTGKMVNSIHNVFPLFARGRLVGTVCFIQDFSVVEQRLDAMFKPELMKNLQAGQTRQKQKRPRTFENGTRYRFRDIIGQSRELMESLGVARLASQSVSPVMLFGETGTGKELMAQSIHNAGPRKTQRYVAVNCAAIPENLLEGILFGTSKGAFTGAVDKPGLFERADGGTLFLDEINSMTVGLQAKLLRFLQERRVRRVGAMSETAVDIKLISSVNQDPHQAIAHGSLRSDLFYRLAVVFIRIPPLRDRLEDLSLLIPHFLEKTGNLVGRKVGAVSPEVLSLFRQYRWPGNIRELEHIIEGAMNLVTLETALTPDLLPSHLTPSPISGPDTAAVPPRPHDPRTVPAGSRSETSLAGQRRGNEIRLIRDALSATKGRPSAAARRLGISPQLLNYKLKKYRIDRHAFLS